MVGGPSRTGARVVVLALTVVVFGFAGQAGGDEAETLQRATDRAVSRIGEELGRTSFSGLDRVAVVPLRDDTDGYATGSLRSAVTRTPYSVYTRNDEVWEKLLEEIEWGVRREDVMAPETVQKFGRITGVDAILYGNVWDRGLNMWSTRGHAKISVHLAEVETGELVWSSGPVEGEAFLHWSDAVTRFWQYPVVMIGGLVALIIVLLVLRGIARGFRHATRPL